MSFLVYDGQANADFGSDFEIKFLDNIMQQFHCLASSKLGQTGIALVIFYFVSLDNAEFTKAAQILSARTTLEKCFATAWMMSLGYRGGGETDKLVQFLRENCSNNEWNFDAWLKLQSNKVFSLFKLKDGTTDK